MPSQGYHTEQNDIRKRCSAPPHACPDCRCAPRSENGEIADGFGSTWLRCERGPRCGLEVVRPGKVQCWCDNPEMALCASCDLPFWGSSGECPDCTRVTE